MFQWRKLRGDGDDDDDDADAMMMMVVTVTVCCHSYSESVGAKHYHTSAKLNKGIEELFLDLCKRKTNRK